MKNAWLQVDTIVGDLVVEHHRPIQRVKADLHMGSLLTRRQHQKTNCWNAFLWNMSQEKEKNGTLSLPEPHFI